MLISFKGLFSLLLLYIISASAWETSDTCQLANMETDTDAAWAIAVIPIEFSTDKTGLFSYLISLTNGTYEFGNPPQTTGVTDVTIDIPAASNYTPQLGTIFGLPANTTNSLVFGEAYFEPRENGNYTFNVQASDAAIFGIIKDISAFCCSNLNDLGSNSILSTGLEYFYEIPSDPEHSNGTITINMIEGAKYWIQFEYVNFSGDAKFSLSVTTPSGESISDFKGYVGRLKTADCDNVHTTSREYSAWSLDSTSTYASTVFTIDQTTTTTLETMYYVLTPMPEELSITETSSSNIISSPTTEGDVSLTSLDTSFITSSLSSESMPTSISSDDVSTSTTASSFDETSSLSEYPTSEEYHSSSMISSTQGVWSSSANSRSPTSNSPSSTPMDTDDAISRSYEKSTDLTSVDSFISVAQTSNPVLTTSKTGSVSERVSSVDITSSLADTMFFRNSSSLATEYLTTTSNIDDSSTAGEGHTTDIGDEYTSVTHTNTKCTKSPIEDNWKINNTNLNSVLTRETSFTVTTTDISSTNDDQVSATNKATHPLNTPTSKYGESNDKPNGDDIYDPVNTKPLTNSLSNVVPDLTQAAPSGATIMVISGSSNSPVVSVYAVETVNVGRRLCIQTISILLPILLLI